ncbi:hypothetical protein VNI00_019045, partial [Paramarasmius palmivorus]
WVFLRHRPPSSYAGERLAESLWGRKIYLAAQSLTSLGVVASSSLQLSTQWQQANDRWGKRTTTAATYVPSPSNSRWAPRRIGEGKKNRQLATPPPTPHTKATCVFFGSFVRLETHDWCKTFSLRRQKRTPSPLYSASSGRIKKLMAKPRPPLLNQPMKKKKGAVVDASGQSAWQGMPCEKCLLLLVSAWFFSGAEDAETKGKGKA